MAVHRILWRTRYKEPLYLLGHIKETKIKIRLPWLCAGNFNEITRAHEKSGGRLRPRKQMEDFRDVLDECRFQDLEFSSNKFTWCNGHGEGHTVWERLDKAVGSVEWMDMFLASKGVHLECGTSDHKPLMILLASIPKKSNKLWRFEQMWMEDVGCREVVENA